MGDVADMMLEGDLCAGCGEFIDEDGGDGIPRYCSPECARQCGVDESLEAIRAQSPDMPWECLKCDRTFATQKSYEQHYRAKHALPGPTECPKCGKKLRTAVGVEQHIHSKHRAPQVAP